VKRATSGRSRSKRTRAKQIDASRRLDLLWGSLSRSVRGPKPGLSIEQVVSVAIGIADREGLAAVTMRRVADELGFTTMALYRYVPGKDELFDLMADSCIGQPPAAPPNERPGDWATGLRRWARADLATYQSHPWLLELIVRGPQGPNWFAWVEAAVSALADTGLTAGESLAMASLIDNQVRGAAQLFLGMARAEQETGTPDAWGETFAATLERIAGDVRFPALSRIMAAGGFSQEMGPAEDPFEFGLDRLLEGIGAYIDARPAASRGKRPAQSRRKT
jgi:AcrR family transcriptional regulator